MKQFVAISLVFFSLTQLAQVERATALRLLSEGYCEQQLTVQRDARKSDSMNDTVHTHFLSSSELALIGALSEPKSTTYRLHDQYVSDLIVISAPNNNSPPFFL